MLVCESRTANTYIEIRFSFEAELAKKKSKLSFYGFNENESFRMVITAFQRERRGGEIETEDADPRDV